MKSVERQFGDIKVTVREFDAWTGMQLIPRLGAVLGLLMPDGGGLSLATAIPALCKAVGEDEKLMLDLLASTTVIKDDKVFPVTDRDSFNTAFTGQLWDVTQVLGLVLEVSFTDFLSKCMAALETAGSDAQDPKEEPS